MISPAISIYWTLVPVWEVQEGQVAHTLRKVGKAEVPSVTELD